MCKVNRPNTPPGSHTTEKGRWSIPWAGGADVDVALWGLRTDDFVCDSAVPSTVLQQALWAPPWIPPLRYRYEASEKNFVIRPQVARLEG